MKHKLIPALICVCLLAPAGAAQTPAPRPEIRIEPDIVVTPEVSVRVPLIPNIRVDLPDIHIAPLPPINIDIPDIDININDGDFWFDSEQTEREELKQTYQLAPGARVELSNIDGPVRVEPIDSGAAEVRILSYSWSTNARKLTVETTGNSLTLRGPEPNARDYDDTHHSVTLKLPRRSELVINNARDSVHVGDMEGSVRLNGVRGNVNIAQATGTAELMHVSGSVSLILARLGAQGVRVQDVSGKVSLRFLDDLNADLQTTNIKGKVYVEVPNVSVQGEMNRADFRAKVGTGGPNISITDVTGTVRLARARSVTELVSAMKTGERSSARAETTRELALHASQPQARAALVEALQNTDNNSSIQATAARALVPYATESDVRAAFIRATDAGRSDSLRATVLRALARNYAGARDVRDILLRALATDKSNQIRQTAAAALAKQVDDRDVQRALMEALKTDTNDSVRLRATAALSKRAEDAEVYALLTEAAKNDRKRSVRARALDGLAARLNQHPELRPLFISYLDDESISMQYHALKGLVGLNDPALRQRLIDKSRELILLNGRRNWNDQLVLNTVLLLRKLDAQEADRALEQLAAERERTGRF